MFYRSRESYGLRYLPPTLNLAHTLTPVLTHTPKSRMAERIIRQIDDLRIDGEYEYEYEYEYE